MDESSSPNDEPVIATTTRSEPNTKSTIGKGKKMKTRRGYKRKYKNNKKSISLTVIGNNCSGLASKKESLNFAINAVVPSVILLQETMLKKVGLLNLQGYQIFEKVRPNKNGGGLLTAIDNSLNPVLVDDNENAELLTVAINLNVGKICIDGTGESQ